MKLINLNDCIVEDQDQDLKIKRLSLESILRTGKTIDLNKAAKILEVDPEIVIEWSKDYFKKRKDSKKEMAIKMKNSHPYKSNRKIAIELGISAMTVGRYLKINQ